MSPRRAKKSTQRTRQVPRPSFQVLKKARQKLRPKSLREQRTESALREGKQRWKAIFDSSQDGILIADMAQKKFLDCNKKIAKMLGYSKEELLSLSVKDIHPAKELKRALTGFHRLSKGQATVVADIPVKCRDGSFFYADISSSRVEFAGRKCLVGFFRDATERKESRKALMESEEMFRTLTERSPNMIFINQGGRVVYANPMCEKSMGYKRKEFYSPRFNFFALMHPDDIPAVRRNFLAHQKGKEVAPYEYKMITKSGKLIHGILTSKLIRYRGAPAILGIITDITDRKQAENELRNILSLERATLESTADGILVVDNDTGRVSDFNNRFAELWRIPKKFFKNYEDKRLLKYVLPQLRDPQGFLSGVMDLYGHPFKKSFDVLEFKDGRVFERYSHPQFVDGKPVGRVWSFRDVTARKAAEEALRENRRQLWQIIDTVPHMIFAKDAKGRFLLVNRAVGTMYNKTSHELIGKKRRDIHPVPEEAEKFIEADLKVLATQKPLLVANEPFTDVMGRKHILQTIKIPFKMAGVKETAILGVSVDVTEQRKVEDFRNDIIRTVSHELRTPLSIEKEGISLLMDEMVGPVNAEQREILETVMRSIDRLARMISSLLDVSSIETGKIKLFQKITDLADLAKNAALEFKKRAGEKAIDLCVKSPGRAVRVLMDPDKITQVLGNLVDNAVKFTPKGGTVQISLALLKDEVECEVRDTGIGIAPENLVKMFEKFQQFSRTDGPGEKGFGLGLSIAKGIMDLHGGRIWIKSELGKGTQATFSLPLYRGKEGQGHG